MVSASWEQGGFVRTVRSDHSQPDFDSCGNGRHELSAVSDLYDTREHTVEYSPCLRRGGAREFLGDSRGLCRPVFNSSKSSFACGVSDLAGEIYKKEAGQIIEVIGCPVCSL